ncbi:head-tail connector protein [Snodgrassella alvi]|uniref:head-tail connector protein n=1 Tax=Snodgrassella alvi TaxID=1196083 RepID=UPI000C1F59FF|nr:head-tail connector protein [Snodgrassella alvi]PIT17860.1 hypothetical protein BGI33_02325 [Snodgrassella alvi]PIT21768.1 hypothetical protein BGI34_00745 [Snodgrassella alvi]
MRFLTVKQIRDNQRLDTDEEDQLLELIGSAAEAHVIAYLNRPVYVDGDEKRAAEEAGAEDGIVVTPDIILSMLITAGYFYAHREDLGRAENAAVPVNAHNLLDLHRKRPMPR